MAAVDGKAFTQMQLQELVYIAHGWCLALTGEPLTGDRPEALEIGPEYRRLAGALVKTGARKVRRSIKGSSDEFDLTGTDQVRLDRGDLDADELGIMAKVYVHYGDHRTCDLAMLTRADDTPWAQVYAGGAGKGRDIPHIMIRDQFAEIASKFAR